MGDVIRLARDQDVDGNPIETLDSEIIAAVRKAKDAGVSNGYVVALLQGRLFDETRKMIDES